MSIGGPSPLGTLLIQRLDAVLGIGTSQQTNIASGARPDAVSQTPGSTRVERPENATTRDPRQSVDHVRAESQRQASTSLRAQGSRVPIDPKLLDSGTNTSSTPSAPTTLGRTAQFILALLDRFPDRAPPAQGRQPLLPAPDDNTQPPTSPRPETGAAARPAQAMAQPGSTLAHALTQHRLPLPSGADTPQQTESAAAKPADTGTTAALARHFTQALPQALQQSGLFYESHLADLHFGQRSAAQLQQEPQNLATRPDPATPTPASGTHTTAQGDQPQALLVRQQLDVLANQTIQWQGQAWPEADMDWTVQHHQAAEDEAPEHWSSTLQLTLPILGPITLRLNLLDQQLLVNIQADNSASYLDEHSLPLRERLQEQGLHLSQLHIDTNPESGEPPHAV